MPWYELSSPKDPKLDELAKRFGLHPLHLEDVRSDDERIKVEQMPQYTFAVLKPISVEKDGTVTTTTIDLFAGNADGEAFFISVADAASPTTTEAFARAHREGADEKPARLLYVILDTIVDNYFPAVDSFDDRIDGLEDQVVADTGPRVLEAVFAMKRELIELRRVLVGTRDATLHLQRDPDSIIDAEHQPFVRDIYDHLVRLLDSVETQRDLLNNALDVYLSSVANRTNEVMKVLTVLGTVALPMLVITGVYGMNVKGLPFEDSRYGALLVALATLLCTGALLWFLRRKRYL